MLLDLGKGKVHCSFGKKILLRVSEKNGLEYFGRIFKTKVPYIRRLFC